MRKRRRSTSGRGSCRESTEVTLDGVEVTISWKRVYDWEFDAHYGADADGNRGIEQWGYNDDTPEEVEVEDGEGEAVPVTDTNRPAILAAIEAYQHQHEPSDNDEAPEDDDDGYERYCEEEWERRSER